MLRLATLASSLLVTLVLAGGARAEMPETLAGFAIERTSYDYPTLVARLDEAIAESPLNKLSAASATVGAKSLGIEIPGNMVIHAFAPSFAVRMLEASTAAGYEAPLRFYITENADGTATLAYRPATVVFAAYADGGESLKLLAAELDAIQAAIAAATIGE